MLSHYLNLQQSHQLTDLTCSHLNAKKYYQLKYVSRFLSQNVYPKSRLSSFFCFFF